MLWKSRIYLSQIPRFSVENVICTTCLSTPAAWNPSWSARNITSNWNAQHPDSQFPIMHVFRLSRVYFNLMKVTLHPGLRFSQRTCAPVWRGGFSCAYQPSCFHIGLKALRRRRCVMAYWHGQCENLEKWSSDHALKHVCIENGSPYSSWSSIMLQRQNY